MEEEKLEIITNPQQIIKPLIEVLKECNDSIIFGLHSIERTDSFSESDIQKEATDYKEIIIPFRIGEIETDISILKSKYKNWLLKKGVEDLIKGINLSLIEAYFYEEQQKLNGTSYKSYKELESKIDKLRKDALAKNNLPEQIEQLGFSNWIYKDPIISLNKVRACLVHRNGIVTKEKDLNDKINNKLILSYYASEIVYIDSQGNQTENIKGSGLGFMNKIKQKEFSPNERITFNHKEFNACMYTSFLFITEVVEKLKSKYLIK